MRHLHIPSVFNNLRSMKQIILTLSAKHRGLGQVPTHEGSPVRSIVCWIANSCNPFLIFLPPRPFREAVLFEIAHVASVPR
jgi:hypothetical protein